ncbi:MAG: universal stress protein [Planctomycetales bacterium]
MAAPISRILCPIDFSSTSHLALDYAARLSLSLGAGLIIGHAFETPFPLASQDQPADSSIAQQLREIPVALPEAAVTRVLHAGPPGAVICWLAQRHECDLIVIGTHGRTGLKHLLLGSVAEHVMRHARCPVLTVRAGAADEPELAEPVVLPVKAPRLM